MELKQTYSTFRLKGKVIGIYNPHFYDTGLSDNGKWNKIQFGVKVKKNSIIYVQLMGIESVNNNKYKSSIIIDKHTQLIPYEAVEYLRENLIENMSVIVNGYIKYEEYNSEIQTNFNIREIELNVDDKDYYKHFTNEIIYDSITEQGIKTKLINKKNNSFDVVEYEFICNDKFRDYFSKNVEVGQVIKIHGEVLHEICLTIDENNDKIISGKMIKGLNILGGSKLDIIYNMSELDMLMSFKEHSKVNLSNVNEFGF